MLSARAVHAAGLLGPSPRGDVGAPGDAAQGEGVAAALALLGLAVALAVASHSSDDHAKTHRLLQGKRRR